MLVVNTGVDKEVKRTYGTLLLHLVALMQSINSDVVSANIHGRVSSICVFWKERVVQHCMSMSGESFLR